MRWKLNMILFGQKKVKPTVYATVIKKDGTRIPLGIISGRRSLLTRLRQRRLRKGLRG